MKILHASDLHYSPSNLVEADKCFGHAVEKAIEGNVEVAILTGDLTDHALDGHSPALLALAKRLKQLADHCPVFLLQGTFSHEPVGLLKMLEMIGAKHPIIVSDKIGMIGLAAGQWIEYDPTYTDIKYDLVITSVPTVNKADLALVVDADNANVEMGNYLAALLGLFGPANAALRRQGIPTVLASHGTVDGSMNESGVPMAGLDHEFSLGSLYSAGASATMLGHIHMHQTWSREYDGHTQVIAYPGSIGRYHYGELGEKYCLIWHVSANTASFETVETPSRRMLEVSFEGIPSMEDLATLKDMCRGMYVRVRYIVDEEYAKTVDRQAIKQILAEAAEVKIEGEVLTIQRQRCAGISSLGSVEERFLKWCEFTQTPTTGLVERLAQLKTMTPEDIATAFAQSNKRPPAPAPTALPSAVHETHPEDFAECDVF